MTKLKNPVGIKKEIKKDDHKVIVSWEAPSDAPVKYGVKFMDADDPHKFFEVKTVPDATDAGGKKQVEITFATPEEIRQFDLLENYLAQVQARSNTPEENSDWATEVMWITGPSMTIKIGSTSYTLSKNEKSKSTVYRLPVSKDEPMVITYDDLTKFVKAISSELVMPKTYPDGKEIAASLNIYEFAIDTSKKLFSIDIALILNWEVVPGLSVEKMGLTIKRTDGTL